MKTKRRTGVVRKRKIAPIADSPLTEAERLEKVSRYSRPIKIF